MSDQLAGLREREAFEAHIRTEFPTVLDEYLFGRTSKGHYGSLVVERAWRAWSRAVLSRPQELADPAEPCIHEWVSSLRPDIMQGEWCHKCMTPRATPAEPTKAQWNLDSEAAGLLAATIGLEDFAPIALAVMRSPDGHGLHVWLTDYPEEGSILLVESATPAEPSVRPQDRPSATEPARYESQRTFELYAQQMGCRDLEATQEDGEIRYRNPFTQDKWNFWRASRDAISSSATEPDRNAALTEAIKALPHVTTQRREFVERTKVLDAITKEQT